MPSVAFGWAVEMDGRIVRILFDGQPGPQEVVCRHPRTWGWVLYSQGTCWTSWEMPECRENMCSDPCSGRNPYAGCRRRCSVTSERPQCSVGIFLETLLD